MDYARRRESYNFSGGGGGNHEDDDSNEDASKKHRLAAAASCSSSSSASASASRAVEKEHMFDKVVTPSDVGKLNRLVIPKQHAEKYFPLDTAAHEKGLLLSFEDRGGKPWRFRYSYWNSSQSYVMTKGWSRFVKEKRLDAGDTVSFGRGIDDKDRLFIDWRRRPDAHQPPRQLPRVPLPPNYHHHHHHHPMVSFARSVGPWAAAGRTLLVPPNHQNYMSYNAAAGGSGGGGQYLVFRSAGVAGPPQVPVVLESVPVQSQQGGAKRVRLFGVNLDPPPPDSDADPSSSSPSPKGKEKLSLDLDM